MENLDRDPGSVELSGIAVLSASDVWLVGSLLPTASSDSLLTPCLVMHWDGQRWNPLPVPLSGFQTCFLSSITALSDNDIWAVGSTQIFAPGSVSGNQVLMLYWNGQKWAVVPAPNPGDSNDLNHIVARTPNDIWAAGSMSNTSLSSIINAKPGPFDTLIEHWDGHRWSVVPSPSPGTEINEVTDMTVLSADNAWITGSYSDKHLSDRFGVNVLNQPLLLHWDGKQWKTVSIPGLPGYTKDSSLTSVVALGIDDVWIVGTAAAKLNTAFATPVSAIYVAQALVEHWNGKQWSIVPIQVPGQGNGFNDITRVPSTNLLWAVGGWCAHQDVKTSVNTLTMIMT